MKFILNLFVKLCKVFQHSLFTNCIPENKITFSFCLLPFPHSKNLKRGTAIKQLLNLHRGTTGCSDHRHSVLSSCFLRDNSERRCVLHPYIFFSFLRAAESLQGDRKIPSEKSSQVKQDTEDRCKRR